MSIVRYHNIFFDFDGTIADSSPGIIECVKHAISCADMDCPCEESIKSIIGPTLPTMIRKLYPDIDQKRFDIMFREYREHYKTAGVSGVVLYDGINELLCELHRQGKRLFVVSSKPQKYLRQICANCSLSDLFEDIIGVDLTTDPLSKTRLLADLLEANQVDKSSSVMVGDTMSDIKAAQENGIDSIGVTFGFGAFEEPFVPTYLCHSADELAALLK